MAKLDKFRLYDSIVFKFLKQTGYPFCVQI